MGEPVRRRTDVRFASASDAIDAICDGPSPEWLAAMTDDQFAELLALYQREQAHVGEMVDELEAHANRGGTSP